MLGLRAEQARVYSSHFPEEFIEVAEISEAELF